MQNPFLIGSTIYLRPLERADCPQMAAWLNDPDVRRTLLARGPLTLADEEAFLSRLAQSQTDIVLGIVVQQADRFIGMTALHQIDGRNRHALFGITVGDKSAWGQGYGTEATRIMVRYAFDTLNLNRVCLYVYDFNPRAIRVYEKAGFRVEGRLRQDVFREGRYADTVIMGILREEWAAIS